MKRLIIIHVFLAFWAYAFTANAQETTTQELGEMSKKTPANEKKLDQQFHDLVEQSSSWQTYKIIDKEKLTKYQKNVIDTLQTSKGEQKKLMQVIDNQKDEISKLNHQLADLQSSLDQTRNEKDSVSFFGMLLPKSTYSLVMWSLLLGLATLLLFYVYRYVNGSAITKKALQDLGELEEEYENYRKLAIEREQKVRRQLQDEINKHK